MLLARKQHLVLHLTSVDIGMGATSLAFCAVLNLSSVCLFYILFEMVFLGGNSHFDH